MTIKATHPRIIAICKTFRGEEFALNSLASIYDHVTRVIYVHSDIGWNGDRGNTVRAVVKSAPDPNEMIVHIDKEGTQNDQYNAALEYLFENEVKYDYLMLIDSDEIWTEEHWATSITELKKNLEENTPAMAIRTRLYDYIKSPFFRVEPPAPLTPVVFVHRAAALANAIDIRGSGIMPSKTLSNVFFHHFCSVRKSLSAVWNKHITSTEAEDEPIADRAAWIDRVWNQLPFATNCLPLAKFAQNWKKVRAITPHELPAAVVDNPLVKAWMRYPNFSCNTIYSEQAAALISSGLPADFGPGHADWSVPSKRARYVRALQIGGEK